MNREEKEKNILSAIQTIGWLNVACFSVLFVTMKGSSSSHFAFTLASLALCFLGVFVYYFLWARLFVSIEKSAGLVYFKPYRLGVIVFIFGMLSIAGVMFFGE